VGARDTVLCKGRKSFSRVMVKKREFCALFLHVMTKESINMLIRLQVHSLPSIELLSQFTQGAAFL
jgi:hypothetical protein